MTVAETTAREGCDEGDVTASHLCMTRRRIRRYSCSLFQQEKQRTTSAEVLWLNLDPFFICGLSFASANNYHTNKEVKWCSWTLGFTTCIQMKHY
jgi:hypothetical protein